MLSLQAAQACPSVGRISADLAVYIELQKGTPFNRLAEVCRIHVRTVWRVIAKLRALGLLANLSVFTGKSVTPSYEPTGKSASVPPPQVPPLPSPHTPLSSPPPTPPPTQTELLAVETTKKPMRIPSKDEVIAYGKEFGVPRESCMVFLWQMAENEWRRGKYKVKNWQMTLKRWYVRGYLEVKH